MFVIITVKWIPRAFPLHKLKLWRVKLNSKLWDLINISFIWYTHSKLVLIFNNIPAQWTVQNMKELLKLEMFQSFLVLGMASNVHNHNLLFISVRYIIHIKPWLYVFTVTWLQFLHNYFCITLFTITTVLRLRLSVLSGVFNAFNHDRWSWHMGPFH